MKKKIYGLFSSFLLLSILACNLDISGEQLVNTSNRAATITEAETEINTTLVNKQVTVTKEEIQDCFVVETDLGSWTNSVRIDSSKFSSMKSGDTIYIKTVETNSYEEKQLQLNYENDATVTSIGTYSSLSNATYLGEWKCYTLHSGNQETIFTPSDEELSKIKEFGLLLKGKAVKVISVNIHSYVTYVQEETVEEVQPEIVTDKGVVNCNVTKTDLGAWQNTVTVEAIYFGGMTSGDYLIISTEANYTNDERQLQVCSEESKDKIKVLGTYGSLSDANYLGEWKCYTLNSGHQETKFYPNDSEIVELKSNGLLIKGKGVFVTSVKVQQKYEEVNVPENGGDTLEESDKDNTPVEETPVTDGVARIAHDCKVINHDLGDAWAWSEKLDIDASHFADMETGDYIIITTEKSTTSKAGTTPQIKLGSNVNWNLQIIGSVTSCTDIKEYNSEYQTYTLNTYAQTTTFKPNAAEVEILSKNGMIIQGQGVTITNVTVYIKDYSAENPNKDGDSSFAGISTLSDPLATNNAKRLYKYINDNYGKKVITGQMENAWDNSFKMLDKVYDVTGKYPALMGFDFIDYNVDWARESDFNVQTERAINFWNGKDYRGKKISDSTGIVTFCWHWKDPMKETTNESYKPEEINFRIPYDLASDSWKTSTPEYKAMMRDMDYIADELLRLQEAGVPVIWRPFHEGAGNVGVYNGGTAWFWWGAGTSKADATDVDKCAKAYIAIWKKMYTYFTETKGIHNLIWLWNGQNEKFYPGDKYVDMLGDDIYRQKDYNAHKADFDRFQAVNRNLPLALSECGTAPFLENMRNQNAMWSFFMIWNDATNSGYGSDNFWSSEEYNPKTHKLDLYNSTLAITLDDVGDLTKY